MATIPYQILEDLYYGGPGTKGFVDWGEVYKELAQCMKFEVDYDSELSKEIEIVFDALLQEHLTKIKNETTTES